VVVGVDDGQFRFQCHFDDPVSPFFAAHALAPSGLSIFVGVKTMERQAKMTQRKY
jgi:hypothetical protein